MKNLDMEALMIRKIQREPVLNKPTQVKVRITFSVGRTIGRFAACGDDLFVTAWSEEDPVEREEADFEGLQEEELIGLVG